MALKSGNAAYSLLANKLNSLFSKKNVAMMGGYGYPTIREYFSVGVEDGDDPATTYFAQTTGNAESDIDLTSAAGTLTLFVNDGSNDNLKSVGKYVFSVKANVTSINCESEIAFSNLAAIGCFGFIAHDFGNVDDDTGETAANQLACVFHDGDTVNFNTSNGTSLQQTDITVYVAEGTSYKFHIKVTPTAAQLYIDDILRATHSTYIPGECLAVLLYAANNGENATINTQYIEAWTEL